MADLRAQWHCRAHGHRIVHSASSVATARTDPRRHLLLGRDARGTGSGRLSRFLDGVFRGSCRALGRGGSRDRDRAVLQLRARPRRPRHPGRLAVRSAGDGDRCAPAGCGCHSPADAGFGGERRGGRSGGGAAEAGSAERRPGWSGAVCGERRAAVAGGTIRGPVACRDPAARTPG